MVENVHFNRNQMSNPTAEQISGIVLFVIESQKGWCIEQFYIQNAYVHENFKFGKPVYFKQYKRANGSFKHV